MLMKGVCRCRKQWLSSWDPFLGEALRRSIRTTNGSIVYNSVGELMIIESADDLRRYHARSFLYVRGMLAKTSGHTTSPLTRDKGIRQGRSAHWLS